MVKAFDSIIADYAGNKVKVNGEEYKVGACCVDLLNSFNGPEEGKEFEEFSERIFGATNVLGSDVIPQEVLDALGADIVSLLRLVKNVHPFTAFATNTQLDAIMEAYDSLTYREKEMVAMDLSFCSECLRPEMITNKKGEREPNPLHANSYVSIAEEFEMEDGNWAKHIINGAYDKSGAKFSTVVIAKVPNAVCDSPSPIVEFLRSTSDTPTSAAQMEIRSPTIRACCIKVYDNISESQFICSSLNSQKLSDF